MKRITYLACIACATALFTSCKSPVPGNINPLSSNLFGTQTQVVLSQANFKVVKNVEGRVTINTSDTKDKDAYASAYAEMVYNARLQGSQALINISIEKGERYGSIVTYTARGTVIEFLKDNGQPITSSVVAGRAESSNTVTTTPPTDRKKQAKQNTATSSNDTKTVQAPRQPNSQEQYIILAYYFKEGSLDEDKASKNFEIKEIKKIARNSSMGYLSEQIKGLDTSSMSVYKKDNVSSKSSERKSNSQTSIADESPDYYYLASLYKCNNLNEFKVPGSFSLHKIKRLAIQHSSKELEDKCNGYDPALESAKKK